MRCAVFLSGRPGRGRSWLCSKTPLFKLECTNHLHAASYLLQQTGNVLVAEATALTYIGAAEGTEWEWFWQDVLKTLRYADLGDENQTNGETGPGPRDTLH